MTAPSPRSFQGETKLLVPSPRFLLHERQHGGLIPTPYHEETAQGLSSRAGALSMSSCPPVHKDHVARCSRWERASCISEEGTGRFEPDADEGGGFIFPSHELLA